MRRWRGRGSVTALPFDPERIARLGRLALEINGRSAPEPFALDPVEDGRVVVPVPSAAGGQRWISAQLHPGLTLTWAPIEGGVVLSLMGGEPDGDQDKDGVAAFVTVAGLKAIARDLQAIVARIEGEEG